MMRVVSSRVPQNGFERLLLARIGAFERLDGIITNNVILPNPVRSLPNEHDMIVLLTGRLVTIDAKELWPGAYRDGANGWEHQREGRWETIEGFVHPIEIAFKKARVAEKLVRLRLDPGTPVPEVLSCIVVPDGCDVTGLGVTAHGKTPLGARLLIARVSELEDVLLADTKQFRQRRPSLDELARILGIAHLSPADPIACFLSKDLEVIELLEQRPRPVPRMVYLGIQRKPRQRRVRIEVCPYASDSRPAEALMRAHRSHMVTLQEVACPGVMRLYDHRVTPTATVFVYELFSRYSLAEIVQKQVLEWSVACPLIARLLEVFDALHASRIVHRYLDPSSILVAGTPPREVRICDFFGARSMDVSTLGQDPATSPFDPPERHPDAPPEPAMDWFSIGRCIRFMLTGDPFGMPSAGVPSELGACLTALEGGPARRAEGWRRLRRIAAARGK